MRSQPRRIRVFLSGKALPSFRRPLVSCGRKFEPVLNSAIHLLALGHRRVVFDNDFGLRIQPFELSDELDTLLCVSVRVFGISKNNREFWDDAELANP